MNASPNEKELLKAREFIVACTHNWILKFAPLAEDLNFRVCVNPFEEITRCSVQKIANIIEGKLENTTTLVNVKFADFWEYWQSQVAQKENI